MRKVRAAILYIMVFCLACMVLVGCGKKSVSSSKEKTGSVQTESQDTKAEDKAADAGEDAETGETKTVTVVIIHKDGSKKEDSYTTDFVKLGDLLRDEGLVEGIQGSAGYYVTTADGEEANDRKQEWWKISQDGEMTQVGADLVELKDGSTYELAFTTGYY